jgi:hypothetical protein
MIKLLLASFLLSVTALAQTTPQTITFNQADTEHCKVVQAGGKPLLESTYDGTSVAIAMPLNRGNGEFLVFVAISRDAPGTIQIDPKNFYAIFSDPAHTRFGFYDKSAETHASPDDSGLSAERSQIDPGSLRPGAQLGGAPGGPPPDPGAAPGASSPSAYLRKTKIKPGEKIAGWVSLQKPSGVKLEIHPTDMLDEINIPVNGTIFRF